MNGMDRRKFIKALGFTTAAAFLPVLGCERSSVLAPTSEEIDAERAVMTATGTLVNKDFSPAMGVAPPMITPFNTDKSIDWTAFDKIVEWHVEQGVKSIFLVSGSGEYYEITEDEAVQMAQRAMAVVAGAVPILVGATNHATYTKDLFYQNMDNMTLWNQDLADNKTMMQRLEQTGVAGLFITIPQLVPLSKFSGWSAADFAAAHDSTGDLREQLRAAYDTPMLEYHTELHDAVSCPVYGYEKPGNVIGYKFSADAFNELGKLDRFVAIKDTTCNVSAVQAKLAIAEGKIQLMDANVANLYQTLTAGASGTINTTSNVASGLFVKMHELIKSGDSLNAIFASGLHQRIMSIDSLLGYGYMMSAKIALAKRGFPIQPVTRVSSRSFSSSQLSALDSMVDLIHRTEQDYEVPSPLSVA